MPVAMPTWRKVLLIPEAVPLRRGSTTPIAAVASGGFTQPMPMPGHDEARAAASSSRRRESMPPISSRPMPDQHQPAAEERAHGQPLDQLAGDRRDHEREHGDGRKRSPASSGE